MTMAAGAVADTSEVTAAEAEVTFPSDQWCGAGPILTRLRIEKDKYKNTIIKFWKIKSNNFDTVNLA